MNSETLNESTVTQAFARPHRQIAVPGGRLAYWRFGQGPDVVLIHGWPLHAATFRRLVPGLARDFTLHLLDLPGTGQTEWTETVSFDVMVKAVRHLIDELGLTRYALLAHDSGGAVARMVGADDARLRGLVLGNTEIPGHRATLVEAYSALLKVPGAGRLLIGAMRLGAVRRSSLGFSNTFTDPAYVDGDFKRLFIEPMIKSPRLAEGQLNFLRHFDFAVIHNMVGVHARIKAPVLCIWGPDDPFFPVDKARGILGQFAGGAELVEIPGGKLFVHEDHAEEFVAHAAPFLKRCFV